MKYIVCPENVTDLGGRTIFMAGGITGCPDWQTEVSKMSFREDLHLTLINPRRPEFDCSKAESSKEQIEWEYKHLRVSNYILFWFPKEGLCSITLFELGWALGLSEHYIRIGVEPGYCRELDVREQVGLRRPGTKIYDNLVDLYKPFLKE